MTINLIFLTISISKRSKSIEEFVNETRIENLYEQMKNKQTSVLNRMY